MKLAVRVLLLGIGVGVFMWYVAHANHAEIWRALGRLGWMAPLVLLPYGLVYLVDTLAWSLSFAVKPAVSFWRLFLVRWAGESINSILPSAYVGGEALKVYFLGKHGVNVTDATSSAVISKTLQTIAQVFFIGMAALACILVFPEKNGLQLQMGAGLLAGLIIVSGLLWLQRRGLFGSLFAVAERLRLRLAFLERQRFRLDHLDDQIAAFYRGHRRRFFLSSATYLGGWLLDTLEIFLVGFLVGTPLNWPEALIVEAFAGVAKALGMWVPGSLGVQETGIVLIGRAIGLGDAFCLAYALIRRGREIIFASLGCTIIWWQHGSLHGLAPCLIPHAKESSSRNRPVKLLP
ncbi:MAG: flippase-like domain-containing protein [Verrucomicrobiales bacterium]|nr:flippase-like domain-containing protein [Verrucomicrobiales bacterium]